MPREVREQDFRRPEFRDAKVEDYEFRDDGAIVRKDRWERGLRDIASMVVGSRSKFEVKDVVDAVGDLVGNWSGFDWDDPEPPGYPVIDVKMKDGSILKGCRRDDPSQPWVYNWWGFSMEPTAPVTLDMDSFQLHADGWMPVETPVEAVPA